MKRILCLLAVFMLTAGSTGCTVEITPRYSVSTETESPAVTSDNNNSSDSADIKTATVTETNPNTKTETNRPEPETGTNPPEPEPETDPPETERPDQNGDSKPNGKLASNYIQMFQKQRFYLKYRGVVDAEGQEAIMDLEMAVNGEETAVRMQNMGQTVRLVMKDQQLFTIMDTQQMIVITPLTEENRFNTNIVDTSGIEFTGGGTDDFQGRALPYEEYSAGDSRTRYFFEGNQLAGIRVLITDGTTVDMEIQEMSENIPPGLFDIPTDYSEISDFGG